VCVAYICFQHGMQDAGRPCELGKCKERQLVIFMPFGLQRLVPRLPGWLNSLKNTQP
jgi:hypothetical protein